MYQIILIFKSFVLYLYYRLIRYIMKDYNVYDKNDNYLGPFLGLTDAYVVGGFVWFLDEQTSRVVSIPYRRARLKEV